MGSILLFQDRLTETELLNLVTFVTMKLVTAAGAKNGNQLVVKMEVVLS